MSEKVLNKIKEWLQNNVEHSKGILLPLDRDSQALKLLTQDFKLAGEDTPPWREV